MKLNQTIPVKNLRGLESDQKILDRKCRIPHLRAESMTKMTSRDRQPYKMSFATGGLLLNESVEVARLHNPSETWDMTLRLALEKGVTSLPKISSRQRTLREIVNRISTLDEQELEYLAKSLDRQDQQALLWLASCRAYRFIREFAIEVLHERFMSFQLDLPLDSFDVLFSAKAEWDEGLAGVSPTTRVKLRQVMFRMMREANVITNDNRILSAYVSPRIKLMLAEKYPWDLILFPGLTHDRGSK